MSRDHDFLMELLDGEIPEAYRRSVADTVESDPELAAKLERFRAVSAYMRTADEVMAGQYEEAGARLNQRLQRSFAAAQSVEQHQKPLRNVRDFSAGRWIRVPAPLAAAAGFVFVAVLALNFIPGLRFDRGSAVLSAAQPSMDVVNTAEMPYLDPNLVNMLSVNGGAPASNGEQEGINLQINVQDVEQLLRLLEEARNRNTGINDITIQIPSENQFQILGDSQLRRVEPREDQ
jgi:hypothetical protein